MFTLLTFTLTGIAIVFVAVYVTATKAEPVEALAGETTLANSAGPATETLPSGIPGIPAPSAQRTDWQLATVSALSDAEELLDVLESQGHTERELVVLGNSCFAVRWR
jgi:hypothetical protein